MIVAAGETRTVAGDWDVHNIDVHGTLTFDPGADLSVRATTLRVHPGGHLVILPNSDRKHQIIFPDTPLESDSSHCLLVSGKLSVRGFTKTPFVRVTAEPLAGATTLTLASPPTGWLPGDKLIVPDTRQIKASDPSIGYSPRTETATIASIAGNVVTIASPLAYDHKGSRSWGTLEDLPHVANRSRNVVIRSENSAGTRGFVRFLGRAEIDVQYAAFAGLGRSQLGPFSASNPDNCFPVTFLDLIGPAVPQANGYQFTFVGNAVHCPMPAHPFKWGVALKNSHYGLIQGNVIHNWAGAGLITIGGGETGNMIDGNFVCQTRGVGDRESKGEDGTGFWFRGPNNRVCNNVSAGNYNQTNFFASYGYKYFQLYTGDQPFPNAQGSDQFTVQDAQAKPLLQFEGNEVYGCENGMTVWDLGCHNNTPVLGVGVSLIKNTTAWHCNYTGFFGYPHNNVTIDGWHQRNDRFVDNFAIGIWQGDYACWDFKILNVDIEGCRDGVGPGTFGGNHVQVEVASLRNTRNNVWVSTIAAPGSGGPGINRQPRTITLKNIACGAGADKNLWMEYVPLPDNSSNLIVSDIVNIDNFAGLAGRVYYTQQVASFIVPQTSGNMVGSPVAGLTNAENLAQHGICIGGAIAPADAVTIGGITGLVKVQ